jgi:uncharacterized protein YuzE
VDFKYDPVADLLEYYIGTWVDFKYDPVADLLEFCE